MEQQNINGYRLNALMGVVVFVTVMIGVTNLLKALSNAAAAGPVSEGIIQVISVACAALLVWPVARSIGILRRE